MEENISIRKKMPKIFKYLGFNYKGYCEIVSEPTDGFNTGNYCFKFHPKVLFWLNIKIKIYGK